jgi:hypothetical protein
LVEHEERITSGEVIEDGAEQLNTPLTGIRDTFAGGEASADLEAVRRTLRSVFDAFQLFPAGHPGIPSWEHSEVPAGGFVLVPKPNAEMLAEASPIYATWSDQDNDLAPRLDRIPLSRAGDPDSLGLTFE